jgi:hypothetical protein
MWPLVQEMDRLLEAYEPEYYKFHERKSSLSRGLDPGEGKPEEEKVPLDLNRVKDPKVREEIKSWMEDWWRFDYTIPGTSFSTLTINKSIVTLAHEDGNNIKDTLGCMTVFGEFAGGHLVFPRLGVSVELRPRDLLVADNNEEIHGNLGPLVGKRYSVIAYLHSSFVPKRRR